MIAARTLQPGLRLARPQREVAVPAAALAVGLLLFVVSARLGGAPVIPVYAPLVDMAIVVGLLVVAAVAGMDVVVRKDGRSLPIVAIAVAAAAMGFPHMLSFPLSLPTLGQRSAAQAASVVLDVVQIATPALLVVVFLRPATLLQEPRKALRRTCLEALGFGAACAGTALVAAPLMPPLVEGLRYTAVHTALQTVALVTTVVAIVVFLMGHRADRRMELSLAAALILLCFGQLTSMSDAALFDGRWYMANLFRFLPVAALMVGQLTLYADVVKVERRRVAHLDLVHRITAELVGGNDIDALLGEVVLSAVDLVAGLRGVASPRAVLYRLEDGLASPIAEREGRVESAIQSPFRTSSSTLLSAVLAGGRAMEARIQPRADLREPMADPAVKWIAFAPVRVRGTAVGALGVVTRRQPARDAEVVPLLQGIADLAGIAIRNSQDYRTAGDRSLDLLTGLPNRHQFEQELGRVHAQELSVLAIDVDDLQSINNDYGHAAGDQVLQAVARCLAQSIRGHDIVARVGGDEFAALLPGATASEAAVVAQRIVDTLRGVEIPYGAKQVTIGCATGGVGIDPREVLGWADEALYRARKLGRGRIESSARRAASPGGRISDWGEVLQGMLTEGGIRSVYQPIVDLGSGGLHGFEALARPQGMAAYGSVESLFGAALRLGMGGDLDWFSRRAALDGGRELPPAAPLFVNISVAGLMDPLHDVDQMLLLLEWAGRDAADVVLEISEREHVGDKERFVEVLEEYRAAGLRFAMDDVGEGHSTLEVLAASAPEYVKIARSLVMAAASSAGAQAVIQSLVGFARATGALVIAEGLETADDVRRMVDLGVDLGQGYGLGRPEAPEVAALSIPRRAATEWSSESAWARWMEQEGIGQPGGSPDPGVPAQAAPPNPDERLVATQDRGGLVEAANRLKADFLSTISHELRTPLSVVTAYVDLLRQPEPIPPAVRLAALDEIAAAGDRLGRLIDDVLEYSRLQAGDVAPHAEPVDLCKLVLDVVGGLDVAAAAKSLRVEARLPPEAVMVRADPGQVRRVVLQLVSNALKFTDHGGVVVSVESRGTGVVVTVEDTGVGISPEHLEVIFQHFRQADQGSSRRFGGAGLGLSIARSLVEMQGGQMGVRSIPGEGSSFWFTLPAGMLPQT